MKLRSHDAATHLHVFDGLLDHTDISTAGSEHEYFSTTNQKEKKARKGIILS
jgi:hypothetical protein